MQRYAVCQGEMGKKRTCRRDHPSRLQRQPRGPRPLARRCEGSRGAAGFWTQTTAILVGLRGKRTGECPPRRIYQKPLCEAQRKYWQFLASRGWVGDCQIRMVLAQGDRDSRASKFLDTVVVGICN